MTKKDYIAFAKIFVSALERVDTDDPMAILTGVIKDTIDLFRRDNKKFDAEKFRDYITDRLKHRPHSGFPPDPSDPSERRSRAERFGGRGNPRKNSIELDSAPLFGGTRSLSTIAMEIRNNWKPVNYAAKPYLDAMRDLDSIDDMYMMDSARDIVLRFLCNAQTWRGEVAKRIKKELNQMLKR